MIILFFVSIHKDIHNVARLTALAVAQTSSSVSAHSSETHGF